VEWSRTCLPQLCLQVCAVLRWLGEVPSVKLRCAYMQAREAACMQQRQQQLSLLHELSFKRTIQAR